MWFRNISLKKKEVPSFIPADESLEVWQRIIVDQQVGCVSQLLPVLEMFASHVDFPDSFKYACETLRVAVLQMIQVPIENKTA